MNKTQVSTIISIVTLAIGIAGWIASVSSRITGMEKDIFVLKENASDLKSWREKKEDEIRDYLRYRARRRSDGN